MDPASACDKLINAYERVLEDIPSNEKIDALQPSRRRIRDLVPRFSFLHRRFYSSHSETRGEPEAMWKLFFASIYELGRDTMGIFIQLRKSGYKTEGKEISAVLITRFSRGPICSIELSRMKKLFKREITLFKRNSNKEIAGLQILKKRFS